MMKTDRRTEARSWLISVKWTGERFMKFMCMWVQSSTTFNSKVVATKNRIDIQDLSRK